MDGRGSFSTVPGTLRRFSILAGPGYRRFTRPGEEFSPYWDVRARGNYARSSISTGIGQLRTDTGLEASLSIGLEYFTKWHFSVAAHSGIAQLGWKHFNVREIFPGSELKVTGNSENLSFGVRPILFVRGYF